MWKSGSKNARKLGNPSGPHGGAATGLSLFAGAVTVWQVVRFQPLGEKVHLLLRQQPLGTGALSEDATKAASVPLVAVYVAVLPPNQARAKPLSGRRSLSTFKSGASEAIPNATPSHGCASHLFGLAAMRASQNKALRCIGNRNKHIMVILMIKEFLIPQLLHAGGGFVHNIMPFGNHTVRKPTRHTSKAVVFK